MIVREALGGAVKFYRQTPGHIVGSSIASTLKAADLRRVDRALQSAVHALDEFCFSLIDDSQGDVDVRAIDLCKPGEVVLIYADANPKGGYLYSNVWRQSLQEAAAASRKLNLGQRRRRLSRLVAEALAEAGTKSDDKAVRQQQLQTAQDRLIEIGGILVCEADLSRLDTTPATYPPLIVFLVRSGPDKKVRYCHAFAGHVPATSLGLLPAEGRA